MNTEKKSTTAAYKAEMLQKMSVTELKSVLNALVLMNGIMAENEANAIIADTYAREESANGLEKHTDINGYIWYKSTCTCGKSRNGYYLTDEKPCECQDNRSLLKRITLDSNGLETEESASLL